MKISLIMPTYNDADTIIESIESVINQTYKNWELIIINDGSNDDTENIIKKNYKNEKRIKYIYQKNQDQLNAILNGIKEISGEFVRIFHSDDLLPDPYFLEESVKFFEENPQCDAFIGDLIQIDGQGKYVDLIKVKQYKRKEEVLVKMLIGLGRNYYVDVFFSKKEVFMDKILDSYVIWNTPFWQYNDNGIKMLNVLNFPKPILKYRVFEENYINSEIGKCNVVNGNLRTAMLLMKVFDIPFYEGQFFIYKIFNKFIKGRKFTPFYIKREFKNKAKLIVNIIKNRVGEDYLKNIYFSSLIGFYKNFDNNNVFTSYPKIDLDDIYYGKDMRRFNNNIKNNNISEFYLYVFDKMNNGFRKAIVKNKKEKEKLEIIFKFLNIGEFVVVEVEK